MATAISDTYAGALLDWTLGNGSSALRVTTPWVALGTGTSSAGHLTGELAGAYTRSSATFGSASSTRVATNTADIDFGTFSTDVGTITHFAIYASSTGTTAVYASSLTVAKTVSSGDSLVFSTGTLTVSIPAFGV